MIPPCQMNETKLEISENYIEEDGDGDGLSDVEDDVFIRGNRGSRAHKKGSNGFRLEFSDSAKKPLMNPRRKKIGNGFDTFKNGNLHTEVRSSPPALRVLCMPICYILIATFAMLGIIGLLAILSPYIKVPKIILNFLKAHSYHHSSSNSNAYDDSSTTSNILPCDNFVIDDVWIQHFPKLLTESAFRVVDVNQDGVGDVIFGFATGVDGYEVPKFVCDIYFSGQNPCFGGLLALDGRDGSEIWRYWTEHEVYAVNCQEDLNKDSISDCLIGGRAGVLHAVSGKDGRALWSFTEGPAKNPIMNVYTPQFIRDLDGDGILDVLVIHGGDPLADPGSKTRLSGRLLLISGKDGKILQWTGTPDQSESYYSPQILTRADGSDWILFGTGGETHGGGLWIISMVDLYKGQIQNAIEIYKDEKKGVMVPPVLTDINKDGIDDIVMAMFNSTVIAFDGQTFAQLWNHSFPSSETYTTPTPGYFNDDDIPDFLVKYQTGPGFPIYYHAQTTILDGRTGKPFLTNPIIDTIGSQSSTPLIRVQGYGNDIFLYWSSNCKGYQGNSSEFNFVKGTNVHEQSRSDLCKLRFDSTLINQLWAINRQTGLPGQLIYDSDSRKSIEYNGSIDSSLEGQAYLQAHPEMWNYYGDQQQQQASPPNLKLNQNLGTNVNDLISEYPQQGFPIQESIIPVPGPGVSDYGIPNTYGYVNPFSHSLSSQPELTEDVKYPPYHNVRKHGKLQPQIPNPQQRPININRRRQPGGGIIQNEYPSVPDIEIESVGGDGGERYQNPDMDWSNNNDYGSQYSESRNNNNHNNRKKTINLSQWTNQRMKRQIEQNRLKRHIGPHDSDGIQRLISTGTLMPPLNGSKPNGIDLVFATYWFFPAKTQAILPQDRDCIQNKMSQEGQRFEDSSKYSGMDHDTYEDTITKECIDTRRRQQEQPESESSQAQDENLMSERSRRSSTSSTGTVTSSIPGSESDEIFESQNTYDPFDLHLGQMTVYRIHITCSCSEYLVGKNPQSKRCGKISPYDEQPWTGYMGSSSDSYFPFKPLPKQQKSKT